MRKLFLLLLGVVFIIGQIWAQRTVSGKVTDDKGSPIPNASVLVKGTTTGTATKADGSYSLTVPANAKALIFSSVNMTALEVPLGKSNVVNASMQTEDKTMTEVVVVGYGTQKKKEVTGSISSVKGAVTADKPVQTFDQALAGRAAGVQITIPSGVVNAAPVFRIRGTNSLSLSSYPLIVVDGIPSFVGDYSSISGVSAANNPLASVNPNDIESIDIAKDAAATAIYGSRAANGVVFITTKKGKAGKAKVSYNAWIGWNKAYGLPSLLNTAQYLTFKTSAVANNPSASVFYASAPGPNGNPIDTKWSDYIYRTGFSHSNNVNISGGNDNTSYYFSAGYTDQEGIIKKNGFKRMNALLNVDSRVSKIFSMGGKLSFSNEQNLAATTTGSLSGAAFNTGGLGRLSFVLPPIIAPYNNDGTYNICLLYTSPSPRD